MTQTEQISSQNKAKNFDPYFTSEASLRKPNPLIALAKFIHNPENIFLASGLPRIDAFPIEELSFKARDPISGELKEFNIGKETDSSCPIGLNQAQQYGNGLGFSPLREFFYIHTKELHKPRYEDWGVIPTTGNTDSLYKMLSLFLSPGHPILIARWCYPTALETFSDFGLHLLSVDIDEEGLIPSSLKKVPCGQNPSGATMSLTRRKQIYEVAQELNLIIFEDDPYYYLQLPPFNPRQPITSEEKESMSPQEFMAAFGYKTLIPSLLSLDVDGRVLRMDSWAKTLAPGLRVGWITAQASFINKLQFINEVSIQMPSGFSQAILAQLLLQGWGDDKLEHHIAALRFEFTHHRDAISSTLMPFRGTVIDFTSPVGGMFLWLKPRLPKALLTLEEGTLPSQSAMEDIFNLLLEKHVVVVPGAFFDTDNYSREAKEIKGAPYLRICYTFDNVTNVVEGTRRLVEALSSIGCGN